jgi:hypothetical protein
LRSRRCIITKVRKGGSGVRFTTLEAEKLV